MNNEVMGDPLPGKVITTDGYGYLYWDDHKESGTVSTITLTTSKYSCTVCDGDIDSYYPSTHNCAPYLMKRIVALEEQVNKLMEGVGG